MEETGFSVRVEHEPGWVCIHVAGDVDLASAPQLRDALHGALHDAVGEVVVDVAGLTFLDAAGLGVLAHAHERARSRGDCLVIVHAGPMVRRLLQITGLDGLLWPPPLCA
jgi:anti-anti-sigma factor